MDTGQMTVVFTSAVTLMAPILWAALGEAIGEQAGVLNIGVEGVMLSGAFAAAAGLQWMHNLTLAFLLAAPVGLLCGVVLAYLYISRGTDQIVTGILFNLMALGATTALYEKYLTGAGQILTFAPVSIPGLSSLPVVGSAFFGQAVPTYAAILAAPVVFYLLRRTWLGLYIRILGERPEASDAAGLSVTGLRWVALLLGCTLVALGGSCLVVVQTGGFTANITSGEGYIALAVVILCRWNPLWIVAGAALFGLAEALQFQLQTVSSLSTVPKDVWLAVPYVVTVIAVSSAKSSRYPNAVGVPFRRNAAT